MQQTDLCASVDFFLVVVVVYLFPWHVHATKNKTDLWQHNRALNEVKAVVE